MGMAIWKKHTSRASDWAHILSHTSGIPDERLKGRGRTYAVLLKSLLHFIKEFAKKRSSYFEIMKYHKNTMKETILLGMKDQLIRLLFHLPPLHYSSRSVGFEPTTLGFGDPHSTELN